MYNLFNEGTLNIHDPKSMIYFLDDKKYEITSNDISEFQKKMERPIVKKFKEESLASYENKLNDRKKSLKKKGINCNPNWPTCFYDDYTQTIMEALILKESKIPYIINDYYYIKNDGYIDNKFYGIEGYNNTSENTVKEVLVERHKHVCDNAKLVDNSKLLIDDENTKNYFDLINNDQNNSDENKIYDKLKGSKDFDNVVKEIKMEMEKIIKPIKMNEINSIIGNNEKSGKYYPSDYIFHLFK